jgi:hypothetical protein
VSLKFFHVVFVLASIVLSTWVGVWAVGTATDEGGAGWWLLAAGGFTAAVALVVYGFWFLKKTKDVSYL